MCLSKPEEVKKALLYRQNRKVCVILRLGYQTNQGTSLINKYKLDDFPHGVIFAIVNTTKIKHIPKDTIAKIEMDEKLEQLMFKRADDFQTQMLFMIAKFEISKSEIECVKLLKKKQNPICM